MHHVPGKIMLCINNVAPKALQQPYGRANFYLAKTPWAGLPTTAPGKVILLTYHAMNGPVLLHQAW